MEPCVTGTSGPGFGLVAIGYAVMTELPLVVLNIQWRSINRPPYKIRQTDLLAAMYGRHGEAPVPVLAGNSRRLFLHCLKHSDWL